MVASNEDAKRRRLDGESLVKAISAFNVPAIPALHLPIDVMWTVDGQPVACDIKTPPDFIASYMDGRLHDQITAMQNMECKWFFLLIEGTWSEDGGYTVGGLEHGWTWDAFDDAMFDVQVYGGVRIVHSPAKVNTPRRLAALWRWSGKDEAASWHSPIPIIPASDFTTKPPIIFFDEKFRNRCGTLMHIDGWGVKYANQALETIPFSELLCVDPERVESTKGKLKALKGFGPKRIQAWEDQTQYERTPMPKQVRQVSSLDRSDTRCLQGISGMKRVELADEKGKNWVVYQSDPAWRQCLNLLRLGVAEVVLPREALLCGTLPPPHSIANLDVPIDVVRMSADLQAIVWRQIRLKDCVHWLTYNEVLGLDGASVEMEVDEAAEDEP